MATDTKKLKHELRQFFMERRACLSDADVKIKSDSVQASFLARPEFARAGTVMFYMNKGREVMTGEAVAGALKAGKRVVFPVVGEGKLFAVEPASPDDIDDMVVGAYGILEPVGNSVPSSDIDVVVVPVVAFDAGCNRLGYGKGYYDGFLRGLSALKVGFAYDLQMAGSIPFDESDVRLDFVITEFAAYGVK